MRFLAGVENYDGAFKNWNAWLWFFKLYRKGGGKLKVGCQNNQSLIPEQRIGHPVAQLVTTCDRFPSHYPLLRFHAIPVLSVNPGEFEQIAARAAEQPRPDDPVERELAALRDRHGTLWTLAEMPVTQALDMLFAKANRKRQ